MCGSGYIVNLICGYVLDCILVHINHTHQLWDHRVVLNCETADIVRYAIFVKSILLIDFFWCMHNVQFGLSLWTYLAVCCETGGMCGSSVAS